VRDAGRSRTRRVVRARTERGDHPALRRDANKPLATLEVGTEIEGLKDRRYVRRTTMPAILDQSTSSTAGCSARSENPPPTGATRRSSIRPTSTYLSSPCLPAVT